jgi:hypothetical protein
MMKFFTQIMKLPMAAFVSGMDILARTMREFQKSFETNVDAVSAEVAQTLGGESDGNSDAHSRSGGISEVDADITQQTSDKEEKHMGDQDLGGDDLKIVRYRIIFTKRDFEAVLDEAEEEIVDYTTDGGSFGGLKVARFMARLAKGKVPLPLEWKGTDYPEKNAPKRGWQIPQEDERYISFVYEVIRRVERQEAEYAKDKVHVLRQIRDTLHTGVKVIK